ncbi:MAG: polyprenyl synthetase family protein [Halothece sp. Uz-M2-17]|nr:polyprenyl synthetase family protein [Halothece sp. Uz-M2-17]
MRMTDQSFKQTLAFDLDSYLQARKAIVEKALDQSLPVGEPPEIYEAMRYSLLAGGKRLRPILCLATCELVGGSIEMAMPTACALEMIHTMSLIHDDLPAMDNDDYRRGILTNHKKFGEDIAILAGDGLLAYAFEYIAAYTQGVEPSAVLQVVAKLGHAVGATGLVGGQVVDLASEGNPDISLETLNYIHTHKTGALLEACVVTGAMLGGATEDDLARLSRYAYDIGLAFQIVDDILDITATQEELGKTAGKDVEADKATYPRLLGLEASKAKADELTEAACAELAPYGDSGIPLQAIAQLIANRKN